jgi:hypothetical protein
VKAKPEPTETNVKDIKPRSGAGMSMPSQLNSTHRSAFAVIQAPILYSKQLNDAEKIIYGHISNLCNEYGYCYATNQYLSELTGKSLAAVKRAIKKLTDLNFIEINHFSKGMQDERQITLNQEILSNVVDERFLNFLKFPKLLVLFL